MSPEVSAADLAARRLPHRIHAIGAGGAGVSAALLVLRERGHALSGVDASASAHLERLSSAGIPVSLESSAPAAGLDASGLDADVELVVRSAAVPADHPQVRVARERGVPVIKYGELLAALCPPGRTLAVAGTHGKTTTSWMLHHALAGLPGLASAESHEGQSGAHPASRPQPRPGAIIGGLCRTLGTNALAGDPGGWFSVEACEYDRTFLGLRPYAAAITNVEADHLDYYGDLESIVEAFAAFARRVERAGLLVLGVQVPEAVEQAARCPVWRLGRDFHARLTGSESGAFRFELEGLTTQPVEIALAVPGEFNVHNAALALALALGVSGGGQRAGAAAARGLERFRGAQRRFEPWGSAGGVDVVHDYAHHPTELRCTLEAARRTLGSQRVGRLHILFQPHQHSRTARFLPEFIESLRAADRVVVTDVYGARAHIDEVAAGAPEIVDGLLARGVDAQLGGALGSALRAAASATRAGDLLLVVGAGDIESIRTDLLHELDDVALRGARQSAARR